MSSLKSLSRPAPAVPIARSTALGLLRPAQAARWSAWVAAAQASVRAELVQALEQMSGMAVSGESAGGLETLDAVRKAQPQVLFLEVSLPGLGGFEVLEALQVLEPGSRPAVVFLTPDERHAARAFEADADDCVVLPFTPERIGEAVRRARRRRSSSEPAASASPPLEWLLVKREGRSVFVRVADIDWIESARNNVILHVGAERYVHHETTSGVEARLSPNRFLRIHRSAIVRIDRIKELVPWFNGEYRVTLKDGTALTLSEGYRDRLKRFRL
jgi:two-component system, LytTR family, response regulator